MAIDIRLRLLLMAFTLLFASCAPITAPTDIEFVSVTAVDYFDQKEIPPPSMAGLGGLMPKEDIERLGLATDMQRPHRLFLKVTFTSRVDLSGFANEFYYSYDFGNVGYFCNRPNYDVLMALPPVYRGGTMLKPGNRIPNLKGETGQPIRYYTYFGVSRDEKPPSNTTWKTSTPVWQSYNLMEEPEDICFYLAGVSRAGSRFRSNIATIPRDAIAAALRHIPSSIGHKAE